MKESYPKLGNKAKSLDTCLRDPSKNYIIFFVFQLFTFYQAPDSEVSCLLTWRFLCAKNLNVSCLVENYKSYRVGFLPPSPEDINQLYISFSNLIPALLYMNFEPALSLVGCLCNKLNKSLTWIHRVFLQVMFLTFLKLYLETICDQTISVLEVNIRHSKRVEIYPAWSSHHMARKLLLSDVLSTCSLCGL